MNHILADSGKKCNNNAFLSKENFKEQLKQKRIETKRIAFFFKLNGDFRHYSNLMNCNSHLLIGFNPDLNKYKYKTNFCRTLLCPTCTYIKSQKTYNNMHRIIFSEECNSLNLNFVLLTLTIRNTEDSKDNGVAIENLINGINLIESGFRKLTVNKDSFLRRNTVGMLKSLEITFKGKGFHPHLHILIALPKNKKYLSIETIREKWKKVCNLDYTPQCNIEKCYNTKEKSICEVAKYAVKSSDIQNPRVLDIMFKAMSNRRLISYLGLFKELKRKFKLNDEIENNNGEKDFWKNPNTQLELLLWKASCFVEYTVKQENIKNIDTNKWYLNPEDKENIQELVKDVVNY